MRGEVGDLDTKKEKVENKIKFTPINMLEKNDLLEENAGNAGLYDLPGTSPNNDGTIRLVKRALITHEEGNDDIEDQIIEWEQIKDDYDRAMSTEGLSGSKFMYSKESFNSIKKLVEKLDLLNFNVEISPGEGEVTEKEQVQEFIKRTEELTASGKEISPESITGTLDEIKQRSSDDRRIASAAIKAGIEYVMKEGGWVNALKSNKDGAYFMFTLLGDAFVFIEGAGKATKDNPVPLCFNTMSPDRVFFNRSAVKMRGSARGNNVRRAFMVYDMTFDEYMEDIVSTIKDKEMREAAENVSWGELPQSDDIDSMAQERDDEDTESEISRKGQVGVYIDLDARAKIIIAGSSATIISKFVDNEFPYVMDNKPYMPIIALSCFAKTRGFYNAGLGHYMSEINQLDEILQNKTVSGAIKEVDPIDVLTVGNGQANQIQARIGDVELDVAEGRRGILINEISDDGQPMIGNMSKFSSGGIGNSGDAIAIIRDRLKVEMGMNVRDVSTEKEKTAFAIQQEAAAQTALPQGIMERNAEEYKFAIKIIIDLMKKVISPSNNTVVPTKDIRLSSSKNAITVSGFTLGEVVTMMKKSRIVVNMEEQSGVTPTNFERVARINTLLPLLQGTPAFTKLIRELVELNGYSFGEDELNVPAPAPEEGQQIQQ